MLLALMMLSGSAQAQLVARTRPPRVGTTGGPFAGPAIPCVPRDGPCATASPRPGSQVRRIRDVQGAGHVSPLAGRRVSRVSGVVTAVTGRGFWLQDPRQDRDQATSEAVYVDTAARPGVDTGDGVWVDGRVAESRTGGSAGLSRTAIKASALGVTAHHRPLPEPVVIGERGRRPPERIIDDDADGDLESSGRFEPHTDGADFYESLEGMRVSVEGAVAVGPTDRSGVIPVLPDGGGDGDGDRDRARPGRTTAGGLALRPNDPNPERVLLDDVLAPTPAVDTGDRLPGPVTGVLDYGGGGGFALLPTRAPEVKAGAPARETARPAAPGEVSVATLNVANLDPSDPPAKFTALARQIADGLRSPDLITVVGVQDNSGPENDGTVSADQTIAELIDAISAAGGPPYYWRSIDPDNNADGGPPGGNARVGFLFHTERGLDFVHRPGAGPAAPTTAVGHGFQAGLTLSPGRLEPADPAFTDTRKPLAGEFRWYGRRLIAIAGHWSATGLDDPLFGRHQPPRRPSEAQHRRQADAIARFVKSVHAVDRDARIVVGGDLNTADFAAPMRRLSRAGLRNAAERLPGADRYTQVRDGNAIATDHVLLSRPLARGSYDVDIVHTNADYAERPTDRDPVLVRLR